jgi:hypothetical protein
MSYVMGKLSETGERIRETVMNSLQQILNDLNMNQYEITRSALEDVKVLLETAASIQQQVESDPFRLANTVLRLHINFDEVSKCNEVQSNGRRALLQAAGLEVGAIGILPLLHFLELPFILGTAGGGAFMVAGILWLRYRWTRIQEELLYRTTEFHARLKSALLVSVL